MKKKVLSFLTVAILAFCGWWLYLIYTNKEVINTTPNASITPIRVEPPKPITPADFPITELVAETNEERTKLGLTPLTENPKLDASAQAKCNDMANRNYWSHEDPDGKHGWHYITENKYSYKKAAENLGHGFEDIDELMYGWMHSPSHKANIIQPDLEEIGFGVCVAPKGYDGGIFSGTGADVIIVQHFATPYY